MAPAAVLLAAALLLVLTGCSTDLGTEVARHGLPGAAVVRLSASYAVAARRTGPRVEVLAFRDDGSGWRSQVLASSAARGSDHVQVVGFGGHSDEEWNTFVYGLAGTAVSRVELQALRGEGGSVIEGAWVIALRQRDISPPRIRWRFMAADGGVLRTGTGLLE